MTAINNRYYDLEATKAFGREIVNCEFAFTPLIAKVCCAAFPVLFILEILFNAVANFFIDYTLPQYRNEQTLTGDPISNYPKDQIFVTEDNFCLLIEELKQMLTSQNRIYNPYTNQELSSEDQRKTNGLKEIQALRTQLNAEQESIRLKISIRTIEQLTQLASCLLNADEIHAGEDEDISRSQRAYERFNEYYQLLSDEEREALNKHQIGEWKTIWLGFNGYIGMKSIDFGSLYESIDHSCVHSIGGSLVKLIFELAPETKFAVEHPDAKEVIQKIRDQHRGIEDPYSQSINLLLAE